MKRGSSLSKTSVQNRVNPLHTEALALLADSARRNELVAIIGTGVSIGLTDGKLPSLSWKGLIQDGFAYGVKKGKITNGQAKAWQTQLESDDLDDLLGAAEFMGRKLEAPNGDLYARWLESVFKSVRATNNTMASAIRALHAEGIPICTLNYDTLLESVTGLPSINLNDINKVNSWMRHEIPGILHIHGSWEASATCILGIRNYETTLGDDLRDLIQRSLASFRRLLFIGCGDTFADPNFSALISWLRNRMKTASPQHYALVSDRDLARRHADTSWHGFVEPLGYGAMHSDLPSFLISHFQGKGQVNERKVPFTEQKEKISADHARLLRDYRAFLLRDCGQMTIEGVRADMDTAQRKFDLERLFVPLKVLPSPPEIAENDPEREQKLQKWQKENSKPISFGKVFSTHKRLALLALPGGGKTLLLKRLAVAYADPARRAATSDALPDADLTPVLIRCREWREHIHRPILTLIQSISEITGQTPLTGLHDAVVPLFRKGRALLLVDGLDEIHDDALRSTFVENLEKFLEEFNETRLVVTSREAGFSLVAPCLARFCERWRVAPLQREAISKLCDHWHRLMVGESPEAINDARELALHLVRKSSLLRLAENPLLLTMLLVVKHGAGRLPPDRVSLYSRALEVLLDTWNIKGHEPLNPKEAVPQLSFVAFQLMRAGKQTATEKELIALLEEARDKVPQIRRYAKDAPHEFLKRVELRSSLLVEAGHQRDGAGTVPFYQFRHLTFQEYLAAVAVVEGHYIEYQKGDTILTPLKNSLLAEEWKEVIPMCAVLARKAAEPVFAALVTESNKLREKVERGVKFDGEKEWGNKLPAPIERLVQCLIEEAEATPDTIAAALQIVAFFARGCRAKHDWSALSRGPYGDELLHQAWLLYSSMNSPKETWVRNTYASLAAFSKPVKFWESEEGRQGLRDLLKSETKEKIARGLLTGAGLIWNALFDAEPPKSVINLLEFEDVNQHLFAKDPVVWGPATWVFGMTLRRLEKSLQISPAVLDRLLFLWLSDDADKGSPGFALASHFGMPRQSWTPVLGETQLQRVRNSNNSSGGYEKDVSSIVAFHARNVWPEDELARRLGALAAERDAHDESISQIIQMLEEIGEPAQSVLKELKATQRKSN